MSVLAAGIGLATLQGGTAEAQWAFALPPGMWWYYGSLNGCAIIGSVPNPLKRPARLSCDVTVTTIESLCKNPTNKEVQPGESATQIIFSLENTIDPSELLTGKDKGKAQVCVNLSNVNVDCTQPEQAGNELCSSEYCVNPNWNPWYVIVSEFLGECTTEECSSRTVDENGNCVDGTWTQKDTQLCECTLPPHDWPPSAGTAYECWEVERIGGDLFRTGNACSLE